MIGTSISDVLRSQVFVLFFVVLVHNVLYKYESESGLQYALTEPNRPQQAVTVAVTVVVLFPCTWTSTTCTVQVLVASYFFVQQSRKVRYCQELR